MNLTKHIYRFRQSFGRMGDLEGVFVSTPHEIEKAMRKDGIYLGEVLGKHSDISVSLNEKNITAITSDADFIEQFEKFDLEAGTNPLAYIDDYEDEEEL